jgi:hypothetical protein
MINESRKQRRQFGLLQLFGLQLAVAPLLLGLGFWNSEWSFHSEIWGVLVMYAFPPLYACLLAALVAPRDSVSFSVKRRIFWGSVFGAIYGMSLLLPEFASHATYMLRHYRFLDRWDFRHLNVVVAAVVIFTIISSAAGGIAAGTWAALSPWVMRVFKKR